MSNIKVMSRELANRIAAGEVVERPSSVVKELVENAIDAGAERIAVTIEKAGTRLIQVTDNGCGMDEEDALLAFEEHGTSKLADDKDLLAISTLGFRGEAIPSIASVSRFTLKTRRRDSEAGTKVAVDAGVIQSSSPDGCAAGTTVEVRDLFYNVPARKKFLKTPATEEHHIEEVMLSIALGHYERSFELRIDRRVSFNSAGSQTPALRIRELFGRSFADNLLPVEHSENGISVTGYIAAPGFTRPGRREQRTFINRRAVESQAVYRGIREGYGTLNQDSGRYPPAVLYIEIPSEEVDVNVHPAKREVRFKSEYTVTRCISNAVSSALRRQASEEITGFQKTSPAAQQISRGISIDNIIGAAMVHYEVKKGEQQPLAFAAQETQEISGIKEIPKSDIPGIPGMPEVQKIEEVQQTPENSNAPDDNGKSSAMPENSGFNDQWHESSFIPADMPEDEPVFGKKSPAPEEPAFKGNWPTLVLGIWMETYILCSSPGGLVLVDQHAAHERVLFERIVEQAENGGCASQLLLVPRSIDLRSGEFRLLMKNREIFEKLGFAFEESGGFTVLVSAVPEDLASACRSPEDMIPDMLEDLLMKQRGVPVAVDYEAAARAACHNAIRAHEFLSLSAAENLIRELKACRQGTLCPHGRPTMITITQRELEKRFQRR